MESCQLKRFTTMDTNAHDGKGYHYISTCL